MASASSKKLSSKTFNLKKRSSSGGHNVTLAKIDEDDDDDFKPKYNSLNNLTNKLSEDDPKPIKPKSKVNDVAPVKSKQVSSDFDLENMVGDDEDVEIVFSSSSSPAKTNNASTSDGKAAWKSLMEQMQKNQKVNGSVRGPGTKKGKASVKRVLSQSPQKDKAGGSAPKPVQSPFKKSPRLESLDGDPIISSKRSEQGTSAKQNLSTALGTDANGTISESREKEKVTLAPIFLPPSERKAAKIPVPATSKIVKDGEKKSGDDDCSLLSSIIESQFNSENEEMGPDNPEHFDGNVVLLNHDQPDGDPYEGTKTKTCPFYKKLPGVPFCVDAFNYGLVPGMEVYFLSHFHSDHYIGLSKKFSKTIICSRATGNLVRMKLYVQEKCIRKLRMNVPYMICDSEVTLITANHCPGSVMFVFRLKTGQCILHTGDFRYSPDMLQHPALVNRRIDCLYLDTTYCSPQYNFPTQRDSISVAVGQIKRHLEYRPKTLILCGTYLIGKERVFMTLAEAIGSKVFATTDKRKIINALENPKFSSLLTGDENSAIVHVVPMFSISAKNLQEYLAKRPQYTNIFGIKPSGWQFSSSGSGSCIKTHYNDTVTVMGIPYSEHSSFSELKEFVSALKPRKVQPTVNVGNAKKRGEMMQHIENWLFM